MVSFELESLLRLLIAVLLGGLIGLERQAHGRPAGLRTHILVCLGSALVMVITQAFGPNVDPGRAVAGIVTGIGFLGAGVIVKSDEIVRGLTTAACIWFVAGLGIVIGQGLYILAAGSAVIGILILTLLAWFAHKVPSVSYHTAIVRSQDADLRALERGCRGVFESARYRVVAVATHVEKRPSASAITLTFRLRSRSRTEHVAETDSLLAIPEVAQVEWR